MDTRMKGLVVIALAILITIMLAVSKFKSGSGTKKPITAGFNAEFLKRPDGYNGLSKAYDFTFAAKPMQMDSGLMYKACSEGAVDVICGFSTDGRIASYDLFMLEDDKNFFPPYYAAPLVRAGTLERYPQLKEILNSLAGKLNNEIMQQLNLKVDQGGPDGKPQKASDVARDFLISAGLIAEAQQPGDGSAGIVTVGGKDFTEQQVLGEIMAALIEHKSSLKVERKLYLGGTMICFNALLAGDLDLYAEYTGTGLVNILKKEVITDPEKAYSIVQEEFAQKYNLIWLKPFGFNNTYTLTMRKRHAGELGVRTISGLAKAIKGE